MGTMEINPGLSRKMRLMIIQNCQHISRKGAIFSTDNNMKNRQIPGKIYTRDAKCVIGARRRKGFLLQSDRY